MSSSLWLCLFNDCATNIWCDKITLKYFKFRVTFFVHLVEVEPCERVTEFSLY